MVLVQALALILAHPAGEGFGHLLTEPFALAQARSIFDVAKNGCGESLVGPEPDFNSFHYDKPYEPSPIGSETYMSGSITTTYKLADSRLYSLHDYHAVVTKQWVEGRQISLEQCKLVLDRMLPVCGYPLTARIVHSRRSDLKDLATWSLTWVPEYRGVPFASRAQVGSASLDCETGRPRSIYFPTLVWPPDDLEATVTPEAARSVMVAEAFRQGVADFEWTREPLKVIAWKDDKDAPDRHAWKDKRWEDCPQGTVAYEATLTDRSAKTAKGHPLWLSFHVDAKTGALLRVFDNREY